MGNRLYIVDYDIPEKPARKRVQFYRDMKTLCNSSHIEHSTLSVFRTQDKMLAQAIYLLVVTHGGHGHVYYGEEITNELALQ